MSEKKVAVLAKFKAKEGMEEKARQALMACIEPTRAELSCINYDLHQALDDKSMFMMYENWASKEALEEHLQMPYLKSLLGSANELFSEPIDIILWEMISKKQ